MIPTLAAALEERGYATLTDVQQAVVSPEYDGADLLVSAQTGSGKTVGFGLAIAADVLDEEGRAGPAGMPAALVVAPTRELAMQVHREFEWLYGKTGAVIRSCVGGMDPRTERRALERGAHIVVGTPGRLRDHINRGALDLTMVQAIVLDEADEMLDLGFREDLEFMLGEAPEERRTLMFSATVPPMIAKLATDFQNDAIRVEVKSVERQHSDISYQAVTVAQHDVENSIINMLLFHDAKNAIVFANTRAAVARLTARLSNRGFQVVSLSGELTQTERTHALQAMRDGRARVCVATDVAARGIDLPGLELVIHAEPPQNTEALLHRSGRTGRAGRKGISALIVPPRVKGKASRLLKWAKIEAEWCDAPSAEEVQAKEEERLLDNPILAGEVTEEQAAFAARLLEKYAPEQVAAAFLSLYQERRSAPEELGSPAKERRPKEEFGPSKWFALSVGRKDRAEPRWILPMICKRTGLDKTSIGKIRIVDDRSFVEVKEVDATALVAKMGPEFGLEDGMSLKVEDNPPQFEDRKPRGPRPDRPGKFDKPRRDDRDRGDRDRGERRPREDCPDRDDRPKFDRPKSDKPWSDKPRSDKPRSDKPHFDKPKFDKPRSDKPKSDKPRWDKAPRKDREDRPAKFDKPRRDDRPSKPRSAAGPKSGKPKFDPSDPSQGRKPRAGAKPKGGAKGFGKKKGGDSKPFRKSR